jgi:hypothetical protein
VFRISYKKWGRYYRKTLIPMNNCKIIITIILAIQLFVQPIVVFQTQDQLRKVKDSVNTEIASFDYDSERRRVSKITSGASAL